MKKSELKAVLKPLIKECIKEVIFEEGVLSGIISEVVQGMGAAPLVERQEKPLPRTIQRSQQPDDSKLQDRKQKLSENRKRMLEAISKDSYNGVDLFEGTRPISRAGNTSSEPSAQGPLAGVDPGDAGVDISNLIPGMNYKGLF
tara:strand:+ start:274 stop:705 length:432 start_codon:yes stop_codon:yes gene_type:complete